MYCDNIEGTDLNVISTAFSVIPFAHTICMSDLSHLIIIVICELQ